MAYNRILITNGEMNTDVNGDNGTQCTTEELNCVTLGQDNDKADMMHTLLKHMYVGTERGIRPI